VNRFDNRVFVIEKEPGPTSFEIVAAMRRVTGLRKVGHAGTLDPLARGVLLVCTGFATRAVEHFMDLEKEYEFDVRLGVETTTLDAEGPVVREAPVPELSMETLREAGAGFVGDYALTPPAFSALKRRGRRLYDLARAGEPAEAAAPRHVKIYAFEILSATLPHVRCSVRCSRGTYVRSLARDFGAKLGLPASIAALTRTRIGAFTLADAFPSQRLEPAYADELTGRTLDEALGFLPGVVLSARAAAQLKFGVLPLRQDVMETVGAPRAGALRLLDPSRTLVAVGAREGERARDPLRLVDSFRLFIEADTDASAASAAPRFVRRAAE
jgi:tRNA pseudouridine55 synthase